MPRYWFARTQSTAIKFLATTENASSELLHYFSLIKRESKYKWLSLDIKTKSYEDNVSCSILTVTDNIKKNYYFSIVTDKADIYEKEQINIWFRHVYASDFSINEDFAVFYETDNTNVEALFLILDDALKRLSFEICKKQR